MIVQPQRLFLEVLIQALQDRFDVVGSSSTFEPMRTANADIILIDVDALTVSTATFLEQCRDIARTTLLCLLSLDAHPLAEWHEPAIFHVVPKDLDKAEFTQRLFRLATAARP